VSISNLNLNLNLQLWCHIARPLTIFFTGTIFLFVRAASPTPAALGATNGLSQTIASLMRAVGPACATSLFAVSREHQLMGGHLVYFVYFLIAAVTVAASFLLPEM
jgi:hypothetical protein